MPKVLGMVLCAEHDLYEKMTHTIKSTWGGWKSDSFKVKYYYGRKKAIKPKEGEIVIAGDDMICGCDETVDNIMIKTLMAFEYVYNNFEFDYLLRTCCGAYVIPWRLLEKLEKANRTKFYFGRAARLSPTDSIWAHGFGYVLSRDMVKLMLDNKDEVLSSAAGRHDDVAVGRFLDHKGVGLVNALDELCDYHGIPTADKWLQHHQHSNYSAMLDVHKELLGRDAVLIAKWK
jgi:hypothetical protein